MRLPPHDSPDPPGVEHKRAVERAARVSDLRCSLQLRIASDVNSPIPGNVSLHFQLTDTSAPLVLDFAADASPDVALVINGRAYTAVPQNGHILLPAADLCRGANNVHIAFSAGSEGLHRTGRLLYSLFVPARASRVFPCFDQPDLKARWSITLEVPDGWTAVSNGAEMCITRTNGRAVFAFNETPPLPTYLLALVAGRLSVVPRHYQGRSFRVVHTEENATLCEANVDAIVELHASAISWLEEWTTCPYPFDSFDIVLIPGFQFGGMEHPGAIYYHADLLLLGPNATPRQQLQRAHVIAHETAHLWFGDLVTMKWFDDVWLKEVLANVMASKILSAWSPDELHELRFLVQHYPSAYDVDRTPGANAIRQPLKNLDEAGSLYGPVIYLKAPIAFRDLEQRIGTAPFRDALRECLRAHRFGNIDWPGLLALFQRRTPLDLDDWSRTWIDVPGRPVLSADVIRKDGRVADVVLPDRGMRYGEVVLEQDAQDWLLEHASAIPDPVSRAAAFLVLQDGMLAGRLRPTRFLDALLAVLASESEDLTVQLLLDQVAVVFWRFLRPEQRMAAARDLETTVRERMRQATAPWRKAVWFSALQSLAVSDGTIEWLESVWLRARAVDGLQLSMAEETGLALELALRLPARADSLVAIQQERSAGARRMRLDYLAPAVSGDAAVREAFFASLADPGMRTREAWVLDAVQLLHHPLRGHTSARMVVAALKLATDIYRTGDIFFPKRWIDRTLWGYQDAAVAEAVGAFINSLPDNYPSGLRRHLLVAADPLNRAAWWTSRQDN